MTLLRLGLVVPIWIGGLKFADYEADSIVPLVANSPLMSFVYHHPAPEYHAYMNKECELITAHRPWHESYGTYTFSHLLGAVIVALGLLIATHWGATAYYMVSVWNRQCAPLVHISGTRKGKPALALRIHKCVLLLNALDGACSELKPDRRFNEFRELKKRKCELRWVSGLFVIILLRKGPGLAHCALVVVDLIRGVRQEARIYEVGTEKAWFHYRHTDARGLNSAYKASVMPSTANFIDP
jgi:Protein of unknown function, DUF417